MLDVLHDRDGGRRPEMVVTDTASYSDSAFGLLNLAGFAYAPQLADLPGQKLWRIEPNWKDVLRIIRSIHTGAVRAYDVIRMLSRDGRPPALGDAIADSGRIVRTLHILCLADQPSYRRQIKAQANLQEGRHSLARKIFHGPCRATPPALPGGHGAPVRRAGPGPQRPGAVQHPLHGPADLVNVALEQLARAGLEEPAFSTLDRMAMSIRTDAYDDIFFWGAGRRGEEERAGRLRLLTVLGGP